MNQIARYLLIAALLAPAGACDDNKPGTDGGTVDSGSTINDSQAAGVIKTINDGEIEQAQIATGVTANGEVRAYAQKMISEHTAANTRLSDLVNRLSLSFADSALRMQVASELNANTVQLRNFGNADMAGSSDGGTNSFDRTYIDIQARQHERAVQLLNSDVIPRTTDVSVRNEATTVRDAATSHATEARQLLGRLPQ